jgi:hypothetical protein
VKIDADMLASNVTAREIHFKFDSITTGNLRDIAERSYNDFVTKRLAHVAVGTERRSGSGG